MRSSSIKSVVSALTVVATLALAAPAAEARPSQQPRTPSQIERVVQATRHFVKRMLDNVTMYGLPTVPIPAPTNYSTETKRTSETK